MLATAALPASPKPHLQVADAGGIPFAVVARLPHPEPLRSAAEPTSFIGRGADGRYVLIERAGNSAVTVGRPTTIAEARAAALAVLAGNDAAIADPATLFKLALALVAVGAIAAGALDGAHKPGARR
jgi:hypothetical protein